MKRRRKSILVAVVVLMSGTNDSFLVAAAMSYESATTPGQSTRFGDTQTKRSRRNNDNDSKLDGPLVAGAAAGTIWSSSRSITKEAASLSKTGCPQRICFRNRTHETLILCWIGESGVEADDCHHFYALDPWQGNEDEEAEKEKDPDTEMHPDDDNIHRIESSSGGDWFQKWQLPWGATRSSHPHSSSSSSFVRMTTTTTTKSIGTTDQDHVETTVEGHAFCIAAADDVEAVRRSQSLRGKGIRLIGAYRPEIQFPQQLDTKNDDNNESSKENSKNDDHVDDDDESINIVHLVEIVDPGPRGLGSGHSNLWDIAACCRPSRRDGTSTKSRTTDCDRNAKHRFVLTARLVVLDDTPLDSTSKEYSESALGHQCHWPMRLEENWQGDDETLPEILASDLDHMSQCLPPHARTLLRDTKPTPIWVNRTMQYGPKCCPVNAKNMCFHPEVDWIIRQGMNPDKNLGVEMFCAADYIHSRRYWGTGGLLLHEFSHAYHRKGCENGFDNAAVIACYKSAMREGLYDSVRVKGSQGPTARAYACTNAMEYFAELSTAFLGGIPRLQKNREEQEVSSSSTPTSSSNGKAPSLRNGAIASDNNENNNAMGNKEEYNKWYPFNRQQIREHDPRAYKMLKEIWKVTDDDDMNDE